MAILFVSSSYIIRLCSTYAFLYDHQFAFHSPQCYYCTTLPLPLSLTRLLLSSFLSLVVQLNTTCSAVGISPSSSLPWAISRTCTSQAFPISPMWSATLVSWVSLPVLTAALKAAVIPSVYGIGLRLDVSVSNDHARALHVTRPIHHVWYWLLTRQL